MVDSVRCARRRGALLALALLLAAPGSAGAGGLDGYLSYSAAPAPPGYGAGVGFYAAVWPLVAAPLAGFQVGLPGTWILPDNADDTNVALCPRGTLAGDHFPERGPTFRDVFQTIEGGLGYWVGNRFHYGPPKFSMNATPDCYDHQIASPGWGFFDRSEPLADDLLGIAQLSNRLLVPPDGLTMNGNPSGQLLGYSWMTLPLSPPQSGHPSIGGQSWTLFVAASNFSGPVAFYLPRSWSRIAEGYPYDDGRGLDARPGIVGGGAMEFNTVPYLEARDAQGIAYSKLPAIQFPVDAQGNSLLVVDVTYYSTSALSEAVARWRDGGAASPRRFDDRGAWRPKLTANPLRFSQAGLPLSGIAARATAVTFDDHSFGLRWSAPSGATLASFPEYYRQQGNTRVAVLASEVPAETQLTARTFAPAVTGAPYRAPAQGAWANPGPASAPLRAYLLDHSLVTYAWYRFVDQPSLQATKWSASTRSKVQALVEKVHANWRIDATYMAPPSRGTVAALDPALIVTPPSGLEVGYVPIVIGQEFTLDGPPDAGSGAPVDGGPPARLDGGPDGGGSRGPAATPGGCGCRLAGRRCDGPSPWLGVAIIAGGLLRRRSGAGEHDGGIGAAEAGGGR